MTRSDNPKAASHAAKTNKTIGIMLDRVKPVLRIMTAAITNIESIIPSRHSRDDIRCDRYSRRPNSDAVKARVVLM